MLFFKRKRYCIPLIDSHIHVGKFNQLYFDPKYISTLMHECGVSHYLVSSTSTCADDYNLALDEIKQLISIDSEKVIPCLWLTETGLQGDTLNTLLSFGIEWKCLKIHPQLRTWEWNPNEDSVHKLFRLSEVMNNIPILIHTGEDSTCNPEKYESFIDQYSNIPIILAHGRPIANVERLLATYGNVYVDTAFMDITTIIRLARRFPDKVLWGTDMCIPKVYNTELNLKKYYNNKLTKLKMRTNENLFSQITYYTAAKLFGI